MSNINFNINTQRVVRPAFYSKEDLKYITKAVKSGKSDLEIGEKLGRSESGVRGQRIKLGMAKYKHKPSNNIKNNKEFKITQKVLNQLGYTLELKKKK